MRRTLVSAQTRSDMRVLLPIALALFLASSIVRFLLADYPKGIGVLPDEIRYLDLASSLLNAGELIQRGGLSSFQKILYPLSLLPAYLLEDAQARVRLITVLNCLYVSSAVFPALVIARRVFAGKAPVIICMLLTLIMPDMCYSMTFLSETLYLPLALWLIALCLGALGRRGRAAHALSAGAGLLCYAAYLCKEVALGFALAFAVMLVVRSLSSKESRRDALVSLACFVAAFALPFAILKLTLFSGLLNSYNQADPRVLGNPYVWLFAIYALFSDATHFIIAFAFFPLLLPALAWSRMNPKERELYSFCLLSFLFILLAVVYTISIREDLGHVGIRPHVRYVAPIFLPLLFLFLHQVLRGDAVAIMRDVRLFAASIALTVAMGLLAIIFLGTADYAQGFDYAQFHVVRLLGERLPAIPIDPGAPSSSTPVDRIYHGDYLTIKLGIWIAKAVFVSYLAFGLVALLSRSRVKGGIALVCLIACAMLANNYGAYQYNSSVYRIDQEKVDAVCALEEFVDGLAQGEQVLIVYDDDTSGPNNYMDVYIDNNRLNCNYIKKTDFKRVVEETGGSQRQLLIDCDATMGDNVHGANGRIADENAPVSYVIVNDAQRLFLSPSCAIEVTPDVAVGYAVYKIFPSADISLERSRANALE